MTDRRLVRLVPLAVVLIAVAAALVVIATGHWRRGTAVLGTAAAVGAALRLVVPESVVGPLGVRGRTFDVSFLTVLAAVFIVGSTVGF